MIGLRQIAGVYADLRANVAMTFALCGGMLAAAIGGAMDYSRSVEISSELQAALDSGVLAAASLTQTRAPDVVVRAYVEAALADHGDVLETLSLNVTSDINMNARTVSANAAVDMPTTLLGLAGVDTLTVRRASSATEQVRDIEISLVLDVSGSMNGSKLDAMRDAAVEFVEVVLAAEAAERTSVSIIPYNGGVRVPRNINNRLIDSSNRDYRRRSGCPELGVDDPITVDLPRRSFDWLEWEDDEMNNGNASSFCPEENEASDFLRNGRNRLLNLINRLDAGGNTGLDVATAWGVRALDPAWRGRLGGNFPDRPADYTDTDTIKVLVVMTDGAATEQRRRVWDDDDDRWENRTLYNAATARANMAAACDAAEDNGVQIYTIAFQVSGSTNRNLMRDCANRPQNYYEVEDLDIAAAFSSIAADINMLRLTQ